MNQNETAITIKDLTFCYKAAPEIKAIDSIGLSINAGEFVVIMGPRGA